MSDKENKQEKRLEDIINKIKDASKDGEYIFRGEDSSNMDKPVSSGLYRKFESDLI